MNTYDKIIVLGAGFSKSFSSKMPLINDLSKILKESKEEKFANLKDFVLRYERLSEESNEISDFENLGTILSSKKMFNTNHEKIAYLNLINEYHEFIYQEIRKHDVDDTNKEDMYAFLNYVQEINSYTKKQKCLIVTFNYDLLIENFCRNNTNHLNNSKNYFVDTIVSPDKYKSSISGNPKISLEYGKINILKLHGSFDWFKAKGAEDESLHNVVKVESDDRFHYIHTNDTPCFIPMAHTKELFLKGTLFSTIWSVADYHFKNTNSIEFYGYGFPKTDINNLIYFLNHKEKIKKIVVYEQNPDSSSLMRLRKIFGEGIVINEDAKKNISNMSTTDFFGRIIRK